ncbi:MAG: zinc-binding protein [Bacteroidetes bacterium CHB5]|nr:zinc-binding protein [Bacteroidetes bacterium CHB5]
MQNLNEANKPLIYSCSGCSSAAQMANAIALKIDRSGLAEMSCIAGVGGNVKKLVRLAKSGRKIIAVDGCPLACAKACLANQQLKPDLHLDLSDYDVPKKNGLDYDRDQMEMVLGKIEHAIQTVVEQSYIIAN